jgi:excisionase family DNA binding protein
LRAEHAKDSSGRGVVPIIDTVSPGRGRSTNRNDQEKEPMDNSRLVFTSSQAAGYLGVSLATVRRWADAGHLAYYRTPGGQRRFSREQLERFVASMHHPRSTGAPTQTRPQAA